MSDRMRTLRIHRCIHNQPVWVGEINPGGGLKQQITVGVVVSLSSRLMQSACGVKGKRAVQSDELRFALFVEALMSCSCLTVSSHLLLPYLLELSVCRSAEASEVNFHGVDC